MGGGERNRNCSPIAGSRFQANEMQNSGRRLPVCSNQFHLPKNGRESMKLEPWILNDQKSRVPFRKLFENGTQRETPLLQLLILRVSVFETKMTGNGTTRSRRSYGRLGLFWDCEQSKVLKVYVTCNLECLLYSIKTASSLFFFRFSERRALICLSRAFCSMGQEKRETSPSLYSKQPLFITCEPSQQKGPSPVNKKIRPIINLNPKSCLKRNSIRSI